MIPLRSRTRPPRALLGLALALALALPACPAPEKPPRFTSRPPGCDVQIFQDPPPMPTDNVGPVMASCKDVTIADCTRALKDEACKLGADVLWGVDPPEMHAGKMHLHGRAAHTKR